MKINVTTLILCAALSGFFYTTKAQVGSALSFKKISDSTETFTNSIPNDAWFGKSITSIGDLDSDGVTDLAVGAPYYDNGDSATGAVYILLMNNDGSVKSDHLLNTGFIDSLEDGGRFGIDVAYLGDLNSDGNIEIAVGSDMIDDGGTNKGGVWILSLNASVSIVNAHKISENSSMSGLISSTGQFGSSVEAIGDLDGDGNTDIAVGEIGYEVTVTDFGAIWILFLNADGTVKSTQRVGELSGNFTFSGMLGVIGARFGTAIANLGDIDNDGITDLAVGSPRESDGGTGRGAIHILFMNTDGTIKSRQRINETQGNFAGVLADNDGFGYSVEAIGDYDGDGINDVAVGKAYEVNASFFIGRGFQMVFLDTNGTVKSSQKVDTSGMTDAPGGFEGFGSGLAFVNSFDGDENPDIFLGSALEPEGGAAKGLIYHIELQPGASQDTADVWPGDANNDGTVNIFDILPLGLAWDSTGAARDETSTTWEAKVAEDWSLVVMDTINAKHADCNGDGQVGSADVQAILDNFMSTNNRSSRSVKREKRAGAPLFLDMPDNKVESAQIKIPIHLGDQDNQAADAYGVVFAIEFNKGAVNKGSMSINIDSSWLGDENVASLMYEDHDNGIVYIGMTKTDHQNISGFGEIASLSLELSSDSVDLELTPTQPTVIDVSNDTVPVNPADPETVTVTVDTTLNDTTVVVSTNPIEAINGINIYPNPTKNDLFVQSSNDVIEQVEVYNIIGRKVIDLSNQLPGKKSLKVQVGNLTKGNYFVRVKTQKTEVVEKLSIID